MFKSTAVVQEQIGRLAKRIKDLERYAEKGPTLSVPIVNEDGDQVMAWTWKSYGWGTGTGYKEIKTHDITFSEVCKALQDMCDIEITYQEIKGKSSVVIYEKDNG